MKVGKFAAIALLVLSSVAAKDAAPSKAELESMYDKAFREFDANNFPQALKDLDAIDARQSDLAESQNLRGVILMRQGDYDNAEAALRKALSIDPKFWNARFNLAEIPFLRKNWEEARSRFQALLSGNSSELQGDAAQLIQYKILLTHLLEGKENMVDSILTEFELSPDTAAAQYAKAAIAFQHKKETEAKDLLAAAEKKFSPQLNKLFAESLYEIGWLEKPAGQTRAALELTSAAEKTAKAQEYAKAKFEQAQQAFQQRDFTAARKLIEEADGAIPDQAATLNLRGAILLEQKDYDGADAAFKQALKLDPKFREAEYNSALIPFKKAEYGQARDRFEALFSSTSGNDKDQAAQLIKYKIFLTLLLEGKESRAQKMMEQFQFTGDTPALYYSQAAWEFKHNNPAKANDWVTSARKIYSPALNVAFADPFYDVGWIRNPEIAGSGDAVVAEATQPPPPAEATPAIEPSPIPDASVAANNTGKANPDSTVAQSSPSASAVAGMEATVSSASEAPASVAQSNVGQATITPAPAAALSPTVETSVSSAASPAPARAMGANPQAETEKQTATVNENSAAAPAAEASATPATVLAPATVRDWSETSASEKVERIANPRTLLVGSLLLAGLVLLAWVIVPEVRRRFAGAAVFSRTSPANGPSFGAVQPLSRKPHTSPSSPLSGGPPQVSVRLKASEPSLRRAAMPVAKPPADGAPLVSADPEEARARISNYERHAAGSVIEPEPFVEHVGDPFSNLKQIGEPIVANEDVSATSEPKSAEFVPTESFETSDAVMPESMPRVETPRSAAEGSPSIANDEPALMASIREEKHTVDFEVPELSHQSTKQIAEDNTAETEEPIGQGQPIPNLVASSLAEQTVELSDAAGADDEVVGQNDSLDQQPDAAATAGEPAEAISQGQPISNLVASSAEETAELSGEVAPADDQVLEQDNAVEQQSEADPTADESAEVISQEESTSNVTPSTAEEIEVTSSSDADDEAMDEDDAIDDAREPNLAAGESGEEPIAQGQPIPDLIPSVAEESEGSEFTAADDEAVDQNDADETTRNAAVAADGTEEAAIDQAQPISSLAASSEEIGTSEWSAADDEVLRGYDSIDQPSDADIAAAESEEEPIGQGQPIPNLVSDFAAEPFVQEGSETESAVVSGQLAEFAAGAAMAGLGSLRESGETPSILSQIEPTEPVAQPNPPATMSQSTQSSPAPVIRTGPSPGGGKSQRNPAEGMSQAPGAMQTAVHLTFSFEIASLQLTSTFKMGALQLRPISKIVTMRLAPSQHPQPVMNLQVTFELATVQPTGDSIGMVRLTPSELQRPALTGSSSFNIAGLTLVSGTEDAPVQLTASHQAEASVLVTGAFQISTVEFSPSFEIASIVLNSTSKNVAVQLPGNGASAIESAPVFEISDLEVGDDGGIGMMQLNPLASAPQEST